MATAGDNDVRFSRSEYVVIVASAIAMLIVQMDWFALNLALPAIGRQFHVESTDLQWVVSGYMLSCGALMVTGGRLADIFGRRKIIVLGLAVFGVLSILCGVAPNEIWLIVARVFQGVGAALTFPVSIAVVSSTFTGVRQARAIGIVLGCASIGTALGPFVGGTFSEYFSWRGVGPADFQGELVGGGGDRRSGFRSFGRHGRGWWQGRNRVEPSAAAFPHDVDERAKASRRIGAEMPA